MLYGWLEVGLSNNMLFKNELDQDIVMRTIYNNKIIIANTDGINADAAMYIQGNNVGMKKIPEQNVSLDVNGLAVLKSAQVGLSNQPTTLSLNGEFIMKDQSQSPDKVAGSPMQLSIRNSNQATDITYDGISRIKVTNSNGITLNDNVYISNDAFANTFNLTSDSRFKNVVSLSDGADDAHILQNLIVKNYELHSAPGRIFKGFIAQEVEDIFPQVIVEKAGYTPDGSLTTDIRTIDAFQITALNTSVIKNILHRLAIIEADLKQRGTQQNCGKI